MVSVFFQLNLSQSENNTKTCGYVWLKHPDGASKTEFKQSIYVPANNWFF